MYVCVNILSDTANIYFPSPLRFGFHNWRTPISEASESDTPPAVWQDIHLTTVAACALPAARRAPQVRDWEAATASSSQEKDCNRLNQKTNSFVSSSKLFWLRRSHARPLEPFSHLQNVPACTCPLQGVTGGLDSSFGCRHLSLKFAHLLRQSDALATSVDALVFWSQKFNSLNEIYVWHS